MASKFFRAARYPVLASAVCLGSACGESSQGERNAGDGSDGAAAHGGSGGGGSGGGDGGDIGGCFVAGTPIATPEGDIAIERLEVGDEVYSYDVQNQRVTRGRVTAIMCYPERDYLTLRRADGNELRVTGDHPIYDTERRRFVAVESASSIAPLLRTTRGAEPMGIVAIGDETGTADVFNITVASEHNYFAGGILVHNKPVCEDECCWRPDCDPDPPVEETGGATPGDPDTVTGPCEWYCTQLDECGNTSFGATEDECHSECAAYVLGDGETPLQGCIDAQVELLLCVGGQTCELINSPGLSGAFAACSGAGARAGLACE